MAIKTKTQTCDAARARKRRDDAHAYLETADVIGYDIKDAAHYGFETISAQKRTASLKHARRVLALADDLLSG